MRPSNVSVICCVLAGWVTGSAAQAGVISNPCWKVRDVVLTLRTPDPGPG